VAVVQTCAGAGVRCVSFPAGCRYRAGNNFVPGLRSVGGTSRIAGAAVTAAVVKVPGESSSVQR
jgi:hypothetical protein